MAKKFKYAATFSDGEIRTRCSSLVYTHAFRTSGGVCGFSSSQELAEKGARWYLGCHGHGGAYQVVPVALVS